MRPRVRALKFDKSSAVAQMGGRLATINMGRKWGSCCVSFRGPMGTWRCLDLEYLVDVATRSILPPSNTMWPGPRSTSVPSGILIHPTVWPEYTNVTDRTDRQDISPVAQGEPLFVTVRPKMIKLNKNCHAEKKYTEIEQNSKKETNNSNWSRTLWRNTNSWMMVGIRSHNFTILNTTICTRLRVFLIN